MGVVDPLELPPAKPNPPHRIQVKHKKEAAPVCRTQCPQSLLAPLVLGIFLHVEAGHGEHLELLIVQFLEDRWADAHAHTQADRQTDQTDSLTHGWHAVS